MLTIEKRVHFIEESLNRLILTVEKSIYQTNRSGQRLDERINRYIERSEKEMAEFKAEMKVFREESQAARKRSEKEMREFKEESQAARKRSEQEMREFKEEMSEFKEEMREFRKRMGGISERIGTLVEDLVLPAMRPLVKRCFQEEIDYSGFRVKKKIKAINKAGEFDVIAASETSVYLFEAKSQPSIREVKEYKQKIIPRFRQLFPEYQNLKLIPILVSLSLPQEIINKATELGIYAMAYREWDYMDILNLEAVQSEK